VDPSVPLETAAPPAATAARLTAWLELPASQAPSVTADGSSVLFLGTANGLPEVWALPTAGGTARRLFESTERVGAVQASPAGPEAIVAIDLGGNERWQLSIVNLATAAARAPRPVVDEPATIHLPGVWDPDGRRYRYSSNARDPRFFDVLEADLSAGTSRPKLVGDSTHSVRATLGDRTLVQRQNTNLDSDLLLLEGERTVLLTAHEGELYIPSAALRADAVYAAANPGREYAALLRYRFGATSHEFLAEYPGDVEIVESAAVGDLLALVINRDGWSETRLFDVTTREERVLNSGPRGVITSLSWYPDGTAFVYALSTVDGVDLYRRTVATGKEKRLTGTPGAVPAALSLPRLGKVRTGDGVSVPYWEYVPTGPTHGTLLWIHGGPEGQARPQFSPILGFLISEGWRVVAPNIRGSTGYGRRYVHLDDVRKRMDSIRDVRDLAEELIRSGKAERGRLGIVGGSYGGFVVLAAASTYPDLWGAAVDLVGISNFVTFLENTGPWRRRLREAEYGSLTTDRKFLEEISPLHHAHEIRTPLLVIHGRNDPRVPLVEAEQIVTTLQKLGRPVELQVFDNEGHGIVRRENQLVAWGRAVEFLRQNLGRPVPSGSNAPRA
jgi:dipeptidyl aminopeptidase/acylaminoacyl peptidase